MALLGIVLLILLTILIVTALIPIVTSLIATAMLGHKAKLKPDETIMLGISFYFIVSIYASSYTLMTYPDPIEVGAIINAIILFFFWPIGIGFAFLGNAQNSGSGRLIFVLGYLTIQLIAVLLILRRAKKETQRNDDT